MEVHILEFCIVLCTGTIMSALAGVDDSPSPLPGSAGAALASNPTCACSVAPGGQNRTGSPSRRCLVAGRRRLRMILRRGLLQRHADGLLHLCHTKVLLFDDCRRQVHHPCLDGVHQALLQLGPNWYHSFQDITNGQWARWWRCPSVIFADHEIIQSAWGCPCPCLAHDVGTAGVLFGVLLSFGWGLVFFQLGTFSMFWNKYTCYNLVYKK